MHIAIDARIINTSTGRYVERLVHYLQQVDTTNRYTIIVPSKDLTFITPTNKNFTLVAADFKNYSFEDQGAKVTTIHDLNLLKTYNSDKNWLVFHAKQLVGRYLFKRIAKTNKHIIVPTKYVKKEYMAYSHIPEDKITQTYEAADVFIDKLEPYKHPFKEYIMYVGQQSDYKNVKRLGDAHQKLLESHPDLGLILVGRKTPGALKNEAYFAKKGYKNIHYTGFVEDSQRDWLFKNARVYIFPSLMEGFGLPGLEAMGYGAPVASSNTTCLPELYEDAAHYFDPFDTDDMARAINDILTDSVLRDSLIEKGYKQIKKYSWERMAKQTHDIYMNALKKSS
jgi:glycosyltransferase involved in cell wall biosynthesis